MGKITSDLSGDVRKGVFYRFGLMYDDVPFDQPTAEWIVAPRIPSNDALIDANKSYYIHLEDHPRVEDRVETKDCLANPNHVTFKYYKVLRADLAGGVRLAPFVPTAPSCFVAVSEELHARLHRIKVQGAHLELVTIGDNPWNLKDVKVWHLEFIGRTRVRPPTFVNAINQCPHCGNGNIACESCSKLIPLCEICGKEMYVIDYNHKGSADKRIPFEHGLYRVLEGKTWDGCDLIQAGGYDFASKRFIDWLLRIHAAPFYAEPVYFCVDGMNDQQKKWFDDLQKPFEM